MSLDVHTPVQPPDFLPSEKVFIPLEEVRARTLDPADTAESELIIYSCGTYAPGRVHEPCQHSQVYVMCCSCAGCLGDNWSCGREPVTTSWLWWQIQKANARLVAALEYPPVLFTLGVMTLWSLAAGAGQLASWGLETLYR